MLVCCPWFIACYCLFIVHFHRRLSFRTDLNFIINEQMKSAILCAFKQRSNFQMRKEEWKRERDREKIRSMPFRLIWWVTCSLLPSIRISSEEVCLTECSSRFFFLVPATIERTEPSLDPRKSTTFWTSGEKTNVVDILSVAMDFHNISVHIRKIEPIFY